jgi:hypothetical protein
MASDPERTAVKLLIFYIANKRKIQPRGRPRLGTINDLKEGSYTEMKSRTEDRDKWRTLMPRACR